MWSPALLNLVILSNLGCVVITQSSESALFPERTNSALKAPVQGRMCKSGENPTDSSGKRFPCGPCDTDTETSFLSSVNCSNINSHPPQHAVDGNSVTYWQTPHKLRSVDLTIDLGITQEVEKIEITFRGPAPRQMSIQRSTDVTWPATFQPYHYFSFDCVKTSGLSSGAPTNPNLKPIREWGPACETTSFSLDAFPKMTFIPIQDRVGQLGVPYDRDDVLQQFTQARYLRIKLEDYYTPSSAIDPFDPTKVYTTQEFYIITDILVQSRCACNGHASNCTGAKCQCQHDTVGTLCDQCRPLYNAAPWRRGIDALTPNVCLQCYPSSEGACYGYADTCKFDTSINMAVCIDCQGNTTGKSCNQCKRGFKKVSDASSSRVKCEPCGCSSDGSLPNSQCDADSGICACRDNVMGDSCNTCKPGTYGLHASNPEGCAKCDCDSVGTGTQVCEPDTGKCLCKPGYKGDRCETCDSGYYSLALGGCAQCHVECAECSSFGNSVGSRNSACSSCKNYQEVGPLTGGILGAICVAQCFQNSYADVEKVCNPCHHLCVNGCKGPTDSDCTSCREVKLNGRCVESCPSSTYISTENECLGCDPQCQLKSSGASCTGPLPSDCLSCRAFKHKNTCVARCPPGTYADSSSNCQSCNGYCKQTLSCKDGTAFTCDACERFTLKSTTGGQDECVDNCPAGFYSANGTSGGNPATICGPCHEECKSSCSGPKSNECIACKNKKFKGACLGECPTNTFEVSGICVPCDESCDPSFGCTKSGPTGCNKCLFTHNLDFEGSCVATCPRGYYAYTVDATCRKCNKDCLECFGPSADECRRCATTAVRFGNSCLGNCPLQHTYLKWENGERICENCDPLCDKKLGCRGSGPELCNGCAFGLNILGTTCINTCEAGQYLLKPSDSSMIPRCVKCHPECKTGCSGGLPSQCDLNGCRNKKYQDKCVASCTSDQYSSDGTNCFDCHPQCAKASGGCSGPRDFECNGLNCLNYRLMTVPSRCVEECPEDSFLSSDRFCIPCHSTCLGGCTGQLSSDCKGCRYAQIGNDCSTKCPSGMFPGKGGLSDTLCQPCDPQCSENCTSSGPSACTMTGISSGCKNFRYGSTCVFECPKNTYEVVDRTGKHCFPCDDECLGGCSGAGPSECTACARFSIIDDSSSTCVRTCPNAYFPNFSRQCEKCHEECRGTQGGEDNGYGDPYCIGAGPKACVQCKNVETQAGICAAECTGQEYPYSDFMCAPCHEECKSGCLQAGSRGCNACSNFERIKDGIKTCVPECDQDSEYSDGTQTCQPCHSECDITRGSGGCPSGTNASDCNRCNHVLDGEDCRLTCPKGKYADTSDVSKAPSGVCRKCHPSCNPQSGCFGGKSSECVQCAAESFVYDGNCLSACPRNTWAEGKICRPCDSNCANGCTGISGGECFSPDREMYTRASGNYWGCRSVAVCTNNCDDINNLEGECQDGCPLGTFADENKFCQECSSSCNPDLGCTGSLSITGPSGCNPCPTGMFIDDGGSCSNCHPQCDGGCNGPLSSHCSRCSGVRGTDGGCYASCLGKYSLSHYETLSDENERSCMPCDELCEGACNGPGPQNCENCKYFRNMVTGACMRDCEFGFSSVDDNGFRICSACSPLCAKDSSCSGPSAYDCELCGFAGGILGGCVAKCGTNEVVQSINELIHCVCAPGFFLQDGSCSSCHELCADGGKCTGGGPHQCEACKHTILRNGSCGLNCGPNEVLVPGLPEEPSVCECPSKKFTNGVCDPCHEECVAGCFGPTARDCVNTPNGCKNVFRDGECLPSCPENEVISDDKLCVCNGLRQPDDSCESCDPNCLQCFGPGPSNCVSCIKYRKGTECVPNCESTETPSENGVCLPCHPQCMEGIPEDGVYGCSVPGDSLGCGCFAESPDMCENRVRRCRNYLDSEGCVAFCSNERPFLVNCSTPLSTGLSICQGSSDLLCVSKCPTELPLYNDTREYTDGLPIEPQLCVASCLQLGENKRYEVDQAGSGMCTALYGAGSVSEDNSAASVSREAVIIVAVVVGVIILIVFVCLVVGGSLRSGEADLNESNPGIVPLPESSPYNAGGNQPDEYIRVQGSPSPTPRMESEIMGSPTRPDPYSMSNDALFIRSVDTASTRL
eukprot:m.17582 g.17582  ORF g.17582 m.17582 type:complete len:2121 (+) comp6059_c0_seq1:144-6506(+)